MDLAKPATELLAANALDALRGPMSRGAVPTAALAGLVDRPRSTVSRMIERDIGQCGATAFDLVARACFDADRNGLHPRWESALASYVSAEGPPGLTGDAIFTEPVLKKMLAEGFASSEGSDSRTQVLVGYLLHCAALLHGSGRPRQEGSANGVAATILELRSESYAQSTAVYASAMRFLLSASRRRPKGDLSVEDLVVMLHSLFDGYYIRYALDPDRFTLEKLVDVMWDLTVSMTEPGFLALHEGDAAVRDLLLERTVELVRATGEVPDIARLAKDAGLEPDDVSREFADEEELAGACLEKLCCHALELHSIADQTVKLARWTLKGFLSWIASLVDDYRPLVRAAPDAKVWGELSSCIDMMLLSSSDKLEPLKRREIASRLLGAVRNETPWEPALSMLLDVL